MKYLKKESELGTYDVYLTEGTKQLCICYAGTGDLHWIIRNSDRVDTTTQEFVITKENYPVYNLFEVLFNDLDTINIYEHREIPPYIETDEDYIEYMKEREEEKEYYRNYNLSHYNDLYNKQEQTITWYSDETAMEVANYVTIKKEDERFILTFNTQEYIEGYERDNNTLGTIGIRFRNSGSRYDPFNISFMKMFNNIQTLDDVRDEGHQIHIEEYLYNKNRSKAHIAIIGGGKRTLTTISDYLRQGLDIPQVDVKSPSEEFMDSFMVKLNNGEFIKDVCPQTGKEFLGTPEEIESDLSSYQKLLSSGILEDVTKEDVKKRIKKR